MKKMAKILLVLMLGLAVVFATVACEFNSNDSKVEDDEDEDEKDEEEKKDKDEDDKKDSEKDNKKNYKNDEYDDIEEAATDVMEDYLAASDDANLKKAVKYCVNVDDDMLEYAKEIDGIDSIVEFMISATGSEAKLEGKCFGYEDEIVEIVFNAITKGAEAISSEIIECEVVDDEEVLFEIEETSYGDIGEALNEWMQLYSESVDESVEEFEDEDYSDMSEQEQADVLYSLILEKFENKVDEWFDDAELVTETDSVSVILDDGEWYVDFETLD